MDIRARSRVGQDMALRLTQGCAPLGTRKAKAIGLIDDAFGRDVGDFEAISITAVHMN